ncbi:MAG TPA: hypothetical protein VHH32_01845 [Gemmatimonadales bacterium]|nr:hypothetical protein [Gemmatimonadales bacterium]
MTSPVTPRGGIERLRRFFSSAPTRQGILARRALGQAAADDGDLARRLIDQMERESRSDGRGVGAIVPTIWRAHELLDLGSPENEECRQAMGRVLELQERPGAFSQGCTPTRHTHRVCEHFISGFFSPAPPEQRLAPVMLPNGKVFRAEPAARFAISCLALRAALRSRMESEPAVERHLASLLQLQEQWTDWNGYFAGDTIVSGVHALALVSSSREELSGRLTSLIVAQQEPDGTWSHADLFHTLETLVALGTVEAREAVRRALPSLLSRQREDGSFGITAQQERALIALRALLWAEQEAHSNGR